MSSVTTTLSPALLEAIDASNQTRPATVFATTNRTEAVRLRLGDAAASADTIASTDPVSIPALLHRAATQFGDTVALRYKATATDGGDAAAWQSVTFRLVGIRCICSSCAGISSTLTSVFVVLLHAENTRRTCCAPPRCS